MVIDYYFEFFKVLGLFLKYLLFDEEKFFICLNLLGKLFGFVYLND